MSKKKSGLSSFWSSLRRGKDVSREQAASDLGIDLIKTDMLQNRIDEFRDFNKYFQLVVQRQKETEDKEIISIRNSSPEERLYFMLESANGLNERLHRIAIPWLTAGSEAWGAKAVQAWATIYRQMIIGIDGITSLLRKSDTQNTQPDPSLSPTQWVPPINKQTTVEKVEFLFYSIFLEAAQIVAGASWKELHVVPDQIAMIQNIPIYGAGGPDPYKSRLKIGRGEEE